MASIACIAALPYNCLCLFADYCQPITIAIAAKVQAKSKAEVSMHSGRLWQHRIYILGLSQLFGVIITTILLL